MNFNSKLTFDTNCKLEAIFLSVLGTQFYKRRFETEEREFTDYQKLVLQRIDDLEKNQE